MVSRFGDGRDTRLIWSTLEAARCGVDIRIHLSDAWYVEDDNPALIA